MTHSQHTWLRFLFLLARREEDIVQNNWYPGVRIQNKSVDFLLSPGDLPSVMTTQ